MSIFCFFCFRHSRHCFAILVLATSDTIMGEMFQISSFQILFCCYTLLYHARELEGRECFFIVFSFHIFCKKSHLSNS